MACEIKVFGAGCQRCESLYDNIVLALEDLGLKAKIQKVQDLRLIAAHGIITTPGLMVNGRIISQGKVLSVDELKDLLQAECAD